MLSIPDTILFQSDAAVRKTRLLRSPLRFLVAGMLAGAYIGVGVVLMVSTAGPLLHAGDGLAKLVSGLVFGVALMLVMFAGGELATSAMMVLPLGALTGSVSMRAAIVTLLATLVSNLAGALVFSMLIVASGVLASTPAAGRMLQDMLLAKAHEGPWELLARGVLCNLLVCLAVWMASRVQSDVAKLVLIFGAILAFISSGFEHVIANMTTYGIGIIGGYAHATWGLFAANVLWVGLGNLLGGGVFVAVAYWIVAGRPRLAPASDPADGTAVVALRPPAWPPTCLGPVDR